MAETDTAVETVKRLGLLDKSRYELAFMVADYVDELNEERTRRHAAEATASEASAELRSARFRHEQATRCAGCGQRKHTPLRVDEMGGYVCLTCIDKRLIELLAKEADPATVTLSQAELHRIQWEEAPTPYMTAIDTQPDVARVSLLKPAAIGASTAPAFPIPPSWTETEVTVRLVWMDGKTSEGCFTIPGGES